MAGDADGSVIALGPGPALPPDFASVEIVCGGGAAPCGCWGGLCSAGEDCCSDDCGGKSNAAELAVEVHDELVLGMTLSQRRRFFFDARVLMGCLEIENIGGQMADFQNNLDCE